MGLVAAGARRLFSTRRSRYLAAVAVASGAFAGIALGTWEGIRAFNECVDAAEPFRRTILDYAAVHGLYPSSLSELRTAVPCNRPMRGTILAYSPRQNGFSLEFSDWFVSHTGSEREPMSASE